MKFLLEFSTLTLAGIFAATGCRNTENIKPFTGTTTPKLSGTNSAQAVATQNQPQTQAIMELSFSTEEAIAYLKDSCSSCHVRGSVAASYWTLDTERISKDTLSIDPRGAALIHSLQLKASGKTEGAVSPMPKITLDDSGTQKVKGFLNWAKKEIPDVVYQAHSIYGGDLGSSIKVVRNFQCKNPVTFRQYLNRVMNDAFDKIPSESDLQLGGDSIDLPVTKEQRQTIANRVFKDSLWKQDFVNVGLKKFAFKLGGYSDIAPSVKSISTNGTAEYYISPDQASDLKQEFYQTLKFQFDTSLWKEMILGNKVMVTNRTASFYGCTNASPTWQECNMSAPRGSFFTTMGYLNSKPSSFLEINNNYGRTALMHFILTGETLAAQTNGAKGEQVKPLPNCLKTADSRKEKNGETLAPYGSAAIPNSGNVCQGCHIGRNMAAGSILFRPFDKVGLVFTSGSIKLDRDFEEATATSKVFQSGEEHTRVTETFLKNILKINTETEQACIPGVGGKEDKIVQSPKELASEIAGDGKILADGIARHIPRALSNAAATTDEILKELRLAHETSGGKLEDYFKAYFASETFSCERIE